MKSKSRPLQLSDLRSASGGEVVKGQTLRFPFARRWVVRLAWLYLAFIVCFWLFLRQGDDWWTATVALYAPRWPFGAPLLLLIPAAVRWPIRVGIPVLVSALVFVWPALDAVVNLPIGGQPSADEASLRVMSFNANGGEFSWEAFEDLLATESPDVVAVQEGNKRVTESLSKHEDWSVLRGPAGLVVASRFELHPMRALNLVDIGGRGGAARFWIDCPIGKVTLVDLHLDTPRWGLEAIRYGQHVDEMRANIALRDSGSASLIKWLNDAPALTVVAGDFNMTTESVIFRKYWRPYLVDSFEEAGFGVGYTKNTRWHGVRIDHILHGPVLRCTECRVCPDVGSDHQPVIAVLRRAKGRVD